MKNVCLLTNIPSPYRLPIFEEINKKHSLDVVFYSHSEEGRNWSPDLEKYSFNYEFLDGFNAGPFRVNTRTHTVLNETAYDILILGEAPLHPTAVATTVIHSKQHQIPLVVWTEGIEIERKNESIVKDFPRIFGRNAYDHLFRRPLYTAADGCIAYSGGMTKEFLQKRGVNSKDIFTGTQVMPQSLMGSRTRPVDSNNQDGFQILALSYLWKRKGIDDLIKAFQSIGLSNSKLVIAGSGPDETRLKKMAASTSSIQFVGYIPEETKWELYQSSDLFVLPTYLDTWGMVVNEALYFGTPVITTAAAGASQLVKENEAGRIVEAGNVPQLATTIRTLAEDTELRKRYSENAYEADDGWNVDVGAEPFLTAIDTLV